MATTKNKIVEQIQRNYARYIDKENIQGTNESLDSRELHILVEQAINKILKVQTFERFQEGYVDIPRCNLIKYENQSVTADATNDRAYVDLPAIPLSLPNDMGVWQVTSTSNPHNPYIPISSQDFQIMGVAYDTDTNAQNAGVNSSYLEQQIGYYLEGKRIYFTSDIRTAGVTQVHIILLVNDMSKFAGTDLLPINPEVESDVIQEVLAQISNGRISQQELAAKHENENA
mgnify:FL=1